VRTVILVLFTGLFFISRRLRLSFQQHAADANSDSYAVAEPRTLAFSDSVAFAQSDPRDGFRFIPGHLVLHRRQKFGAPGRH